MNDIELTSDGLRQLAAALLEAIPNGDMNENVMLLATFNTNLLAGLIYGGAPDMDAANAALDAYMTDVRNFIQTNFDMAKDALAAAEETKQ